MPLMGPLRFEHPPHLPPVTLAPILEHYDPDLRRVEDAYRLEAPIDDRGVVDIFRTVELALNLVDDEYVWPRDEPEPDVHHFVWERDWYHPRHFNGSQIPRDYRDKISFHKGYLPRQLHDFMHAVIAPPPVPEFSVMEARVRDFDIATALFESARGAITARRKPGKIAGVPVSPETGEVLLNNEILMQIMMNFEDYFENSKAEVIFGNEFMDDDLVNHPPEIVARHLGRVAGCSALNLMPLIYKNRRRTRMAA